MLGYSVCAVYCTDKCLDVFTSVCFIRYSHWSVVVLVGGLAAVATAQLCGAHGEILEPKKKQDLLIIETCKYGQNALVFGTYCLLSKSCYKLFLI